MTDTEDIDFLREELVRLDAELLAHRQLRNALFDKSPEGVCILDRQGGVELNPAAARILGTAQSSEPGWESQWGFFHADGSRCEVHEMPGFQALEGRTVPTTLVRCRSPELPGDVTLSVDARPMKDGRSISVFRDITHRTRMQEALDQRAMQLAESEAQNRALIERLRMAIDQIANPVLRVARDVLVMPIIGVVDAARSGRAAERLLEEVAASRARWVIVDVTGIEIIDTTTADLFARVTRAVQLLGCQASISGMRPAVARTMVDLGLSLESTPSYRSLRQALEATLVERSATRRGRARKGAEA